MGITPSQSARNTLAAGVPESYNAAQFLGHLPVAAAPAARSRSARRTLLVIDEASMMSGPDLADLIAYAETRDGKIILAGDIGQLQAVENGGGMSLLAAALGYARLAEPVRFRHDGEQQASLRLRDGDASVLADYDQHGRIVGGDPEQMMDAAAAAYVALTADSTDALLMAADHALRRELSRRIRDDLIALGVVAAGPAVPIADGGQASQGDLIICTRNDHRSRPANLAGRLANGDLLRVEAITAGGLLVRRALDADPADRAAAVDRPHFCVYTFAMPNSDMWSPITPPKAAPCTPPGGDTGTEDRQQRVAERVQATRFGDLRWSEGTTVRLAGLLGGGTHHTHQKKVARVTAPMGGGNRTYDTPVCPGRQSPLTYRSRPYRGSLSWPRSRARAKCFH